MRKNSIKNTRISMEVQRELSEIIRLGIKDPRIHPMTTVVSVEVTPDLKFCKAYISILGDEEAGKATIEGLKSAEGYIRRELARRVNLRNTPQIKFILDQSIEYGVNMSRLIDEVTKDIPVAYLTAVVSREEAATCGGVIGGNLFIAKPPTLKELVGCIETNLKNRQP